MMEGTRTFPNEYPSKDAARRRIGLELVAVEAP